MDIHDQRQLWAELVRRSPQAPAFQTMPAVIRIICAQDVTEETELDLRMLTQLELVHGRSQRTLYGSFLLFGQLRTALRGTDLQQTRKDRDPDGGQDRTL